MGNQSSYGDVRIEMRARNNWLWHAIFDKWDSVAAFCRENGLQQKTVSRYLNLKNSPYSRRSGNMSKAAIKIAEALGHKPGTLFPKHIYELETVEAVIEIPFSVLEEGHEPHLQLPQMVILSPEEKYIILELKKRIDKVLGTLSTRHEEILRRRFGFRIGRTETYKEIAEDCGLTQARIRQIEQRALYLLRHPSRSKFLKGFINK